MNKYKIAMVIPYFGKFHSYFDLWLLSAKGNPDVDFLIFTDDKTDYDYPDNVKVFYQTFDEIKRRAQKLFDFTISMETPYKLCDYRPLYGEMFASELCNYDFWGYCDVDLIWGRIRHFYTDEILSQYDKISDAGHFTLYKNNDEMRSAYKTFTSKDCYDYKEVYKNPQNFAFDEWGMNKGINRILLNNGKSIFYKPIFFSDIRISTYGLYNTRADYDLPEYRIAEGKKNHILFSYENGTLKQYALDENDQLVVHEEAYLHLQKRPMVKKFKTLDADRFAVLPPNQFVCHPEKIDADFLKALNENKIYWHYYKIRYNNFKRKIKARFLKK